MSKGRPWLGCVRWEWWHLGAHLWAKTASKTLMVRNEVLFPVAIGIATMKEASIPRHCVQTHSPNQESNQKPGSGTWQTPMLDSGPSFWLQVRSRNLDVEPHIHRGLEPWTLSLDVGPLLVIATTNLWCQFSAERQNFKDALFQNYVCFSLLLCIQYATDGSIQLLVVDPWAQAETLCRNPLRQSWLHADQ